MDTSGETSYKCTAVYTCNIGYVLNENFTRTWYLLNNIFKIRFRDKFKLTYINNTLICTVVNCGNIPMITNGAVDISGGTNYKCTAVYTCDTGYVLTGNVTRTCQEDANWSGSEPTCNGTYVHYQRFCIIGSRFLCTPFFINISPCKLNCWG